MQDVSLAGLRVLILEDEVLIAMDLEQVCRELGAADVAVARTLDEAEAVVGAGFDAAVLDIMVAGRSTIEFATRLFARGVPVVFATGYSDAERLVEALAGVQIVDKPFSRDMLVEAIARALERGESPA